MTALPSKTVFTVAEAANECGKTEGRIRQICIKRNLGTKVTTTLRVLTAADLAWLKSYFSESGRNFAKRQLT